MGLIDFLSREDVTEIGETETVEATYPYEDYTEGVPDHPRMVLIEFERVDHATHTVHLGVAEFTDGDTKRFMFDGMKRKNGAIVLYDYTSFTRRGNGKEAFVTIPQNNLKTFETVRREKVRKEVNTQSIKKRVEWERVPYVVSKVNDSTNARILLDGYDLEDFK